MMTSDKSTTESVRRTLQLHTYPQGWAFFHLDFFIWEAAHVSLPHTYSDLLYLL